MKLRRASEPSPWTTSYVRSPGSSLENAPPCRVVGHSTVFIDLDGVGILTDPVLRARVLHLERRAPAPDLGAIVSPDLVLVSHVHPDHFDPGSLRLIDSRATLVLPFGSTRLAARLRFDRVVELEAGQSFEGERVKVTATYADHRPGRLTRRGPPAIGFMLEGSRRVYFAGDTDLFPEMCQLGDDLDVALLPVWGWGPRLGPGHLDPQRAARALALLEPRVAVPVHWGTLFPRWSLRRSDDLVSAPARAFAQAARSHAPSVDVRLLAPGEATTA